MGNGHGASVEYILEKARGLCGLQRERLISGPCDFDGRSNVMGLRR